MNDKRRATVCNYSNIIIITTLARLIITKHQIAIAFNVGSFNIRLLSAIVIMLSKTELKTHKRVLNFKSDHLSFSSNLNSIINSFFARDKRLKYINIFSNQSTFKSKSFISSNQRVFKFKTFTFLILINIIRKQIKVVFLKLVQINASSNATSLVIIKL